MRPKVENLLPFVRLESVSNNYAERNREHIGTSNRKQLIVVASASSLHVNLVFLKRVKKVSPKAYLHE